MHSKLEISAFALPVLIAFSATPILAEDLFPIDRGRYVQSHDECDNSGKSWLFIYDGSSKVTSAKGSCDVSNISNSGNIYEFDESCSYHHHWWSISPTIVTEYKSRMEISNRRKFLLKRENENLELTDEYRWCSPD